MYECERESALATREMTITSWVSNVDPGHPRIQQFQGRGLRGPGPSQGLQSLAKQELFPEKSSLFVRVLTFSSPYAAQDR